MVDLALSEAFWGQMQALKFRMGERFPWEGPGRVLDKWTPVFTKQHWRVGGYQVTWRHRYDPRQRLDDRE